MSEIVGIVEKGDGPEWPKEVWLVSQGTSWSFTRTIPTAWKYVRRVHLVDCELNMSEAAHKVSEHILHHDFDALASDYRIALVESVKYGIAIGMKQYAEFQESFKPKEPEPVSAGDEATIGRIISDYLHRFDSVAPEAVGIAYHLGKDAMLDELLAARKGKKA